MATLPTLFREFLQNIRPTAAQLDDYQTGHKTLRKRLRDDEDLSPYYVGDFLQGSYRRRTALRPIGGEKSDVDIIFVTNIDKNEVAPEDAMDACVPFLEEYYEGQWERKGRSFGIELSYVEMDLVLTAAPTEAAKAATLLDPVQEIGGDGNGWMDRFAEAWDEADSDQASDGDQWKGNPLDIPDREAEIWEKTDPLSTIDWTIRKNGRCNDHYVNVVKAIKWWRKVNEHDPARPKSYPLERIVGDCCPDGIESVAAGITRTLEEIRDRYAGQYRNGSVPSLPAHGLPENNVLHRVTREQFKGFYEYVRDDGASLARQALDEDDPEESAELWQDLLGDRFPSYGGSDGGSGGGSSGDRFTERDGSTNVDRGRFA